MNAKERFRRLFGAKEYRPVQPPLPPESPKPPEPKIIRRGATTGNVYDGTSIYHPIEMIDEAKYARYRAEICDKRNPRTGAYWNIDEISVELGVSPQNAFDMICRAQEEVANVVLKRK